MPAERLFGGVVGARDILYDAGWLPARETPIPARERRQPHGRRNGKDADRRVDRARARGARRAAGDRSCAATAMTSRSCIERSIRTFP